VPTEENEDANENENEGDVPAEPAIDIHFGAHHMGSMRQYMKTLRFAQTLLPDRLREIENSVASNDFEGLKGQVHKLLAMAGYIHAKALTISLNELQQQTQRALELGQAQRKRGPAVGDGPLAGDSTATAMAAAAAAAAVRHAHGRFLAEANRAMPAMTQALRCCTVLDAR
jgi:HPt (histidine-containing phosphotransfer) domain-containing protein